MVRWRFCLFLVILVLLPDRISAKDDDDEEEASNGNEDNEENEAEEDETEEEPTKEVENPRPVVTARSVLAPRTIAPSRITTTVTRTQKKRSLECYVCAYKAETPSRSCLDPTKYRVHSMICRNVEDKCFTTIITKGNNYDAVLRGCRTGCVGSPDTTCCEVGKCNNQPISIPIPMVNPKRLSYGITDKATKNTPHTVFYFITILLVLQTVVKVTIV